MELENLRRTVKNHSPGLMDASGKYAVLVPLVKKDGAWHLLYEVRARQLRRQPGEVCFPGGRMEPGESPEETALRETQEELGIPASEIEVLGRLDFIAHRANFIMYPILAVVDSSALADMNLSPAEVDETFLVPVDWLREHPAQEFDYDLKADLPEDFPYALVGIPENYRWAKGRENVPVYPWGEHTIWGLTGRITRHLLSLVEKNP